MSFVAVKTRPRAGALPRHLPSVSSVSSIFSALLCGLLWTATAQAADPAWPAALLPAVTGAAAPSAAAPASAKTAGTPLPAAANDGQRVMPEHDIRAQLAPRRFTTLASEIGAKISRIAVSEGGAFRQGQVLVGFDCSLQQAQLNKAQAGLDAAEKTWAANKRLAELNSIGRVELDVSESEVSKNRAEVSLMSTMLSKCSIAAPFSGRVTEQKLREQQFAQPGQPILDIIDDSVLEIEFLVPSRWLAWVRPEYRLQVKIDETGKSYPARIKRIGARVDPVSQSVKLVAAIDGHFPALIAGMSGRIELLPPAAR